MFKGGQTFEEVSQVNQLDTMNFYYFLLFCNGTFSGIDYFLQLMVDLLELPPGCDKIPKRNAWLTGLIIVEIPLKVSGGSYFLRKYIQSFVPEFWLTRQKSRI